MGFFNQTLKIEQLYKLQPDLTKHDRKLFDTPIEERYKLSEKIKIQWIEETTKTIQKSIAEQQQKMSTGQSLMFFVF